MRFFRPMAGASRKRERRLDKEDERTEAENKAKGITSGAPERTTQPEDEYARLRNAPVIGKARKHFRRW